MVNPTDLWVQSAATVADLLDPPEPAENDLIGRARIDPFVFIDEFVWLQPAEGGQAQRFRLWDFQGPVLADFANPDLSNIIVLKARQLGLSWLALAYALWLAVCKPGQTVLIVNRKLGAAVELLDRIRYMHRRLPSELQGTIVQDTNNPSSPQIIFGNGSKIVSLPSGDDTGTGLTAQLILADEVSKWEGSPRDTFTALLATVAGGGTLIAISTAKGYSNYYAELWRNAQPGAEEPNGYWPIFIPSSAHPGRDEEWLTNEARKYPDQRRFHQEHPEEPRDAFQLPGEVVFEEFDRDVHHRDFVREPQWPVWRGIDFGFHFSPCYWMEVQADRIVHVYGELDAREMTSDEFAQAIVASDRDLGLESNKVPAGVDPAGKARTSQSGTETDHVRLKVAGVSQLRMIEPSVPSDRVDLIKHLLREGRLVIDCHACPRLAEALERAQWLTHRSPTGEKIRGESYEKDGLHEHFLDALGYALVNIWPPKGAPAGAAAGRPTATVGRSTRYGKSEFS